MKKKVSETGVTVVEIDLRHPLALSRADPMKCEGVSSFLRTKIDSQHIL